MSIGATEKKFLSLANLPSTVNLTVLLQRWRRRNIGNLLPRCYHCVNKHQHTYIQPTHLGFYEVQLSQNWLNREMNYNSTFNVRTHVTVTCPNTVVEAVQKSSEQSTKTLFVN